MASSLLSFATSAIFGTLSAASDHIKGWTKNIQWVSLREGQRLSRELKRPAMIVFHKPWCRACKALRPRFANNREIELLSNDFIMISVEDDEVPRSSELSPDGSYIPRILFLGLGLPLSSDYNPMLKGTNIPGILWPKPLNHYVDPEGNVLSHVYNQQGNKQYKYYYPETASIVESMKQVLKQAPLKHLKK